MGVMLYIPFYMGNDLYHQLCVGKVLGAWFDCRSLQIRVYCEDDAGFFGTYKAGT